jgi:3-oxoacyl-[acyl-carrier-protein] synthase-3
VLVSATPNSDPGIARIAVYLPEATLGNAELVERFGFERAFLDDKIGVLTRHIAAEDEAVSDMAVAAAEKLFAAAPEAREQIELVVLCTQNPDYRLPTTANIVQHRLSLPQTVVAFDINQGCSGYVIGLSVVRAMMMAHGFRNALFLTTDGYSKVMDPGDRKTVPLFGDGAAATLLSEDGPGKLGNFTFGSDGSGADDLIVRGGGSRNPDQPVSGPGALYMNGRAILKFMIKRVPADVDRCLAANGLTRDDVDLFIFHQASGHMVRALIQELELPSEKVPMCIADVANTVSSTLPIVLDSVGGIGALAGKTVLLCGFGVGLSWGSTVMRVEPA